MDYKSLGDTRLSIEGSRHYKTPFGALPSVTTILSATQGNKASLERWNKKQVAHFKALHLYNGGAGTVPRPAIILR